eukprot:TRINITY_DN12003_c0_g1_i2.p1 TRINITY_DN12003_c0_g1~~TRINITY_DN12003_c0_g1_i2.p1  ORF type:complete len:138 (+),score=17.37 TRINITY_DN12003_c0_g1_i2:340-753(+)
MICSLREVLQRRLRVLSEARERTAKRQRPAQSMQGRPKSGRAKCLKPIDSQPCLTLKKAEEKEEQFCVRIKKIVIGNTSAERKLAVRKNGKEIKRVTSNILTPEVVILRREELIEEVDEEDQSVVQGYVTPFKKEAK